MLERRRELLISLEARRRHERAAPRARSGCSSRRFEEHVTNERVEFVPAMSTARNEQIPCRMRGATGRRHLRVHQAAGERHGHPADDGDVAKQIDQFVGFVTERFREQVVRW